jgi:hypothetical protein
MVHLTDGPLPLLPGWAHLGHRVLLAPQVDGESGEWEGSPGWCSRKSPQSRSFPGMGLWGLQAQGCHNPLCSVDLLLLPA